MRRIEINKSGDDRGQKLRGDSDDPERLLTDYARFSWHKIFVVLMDSWTLPSLTTGFRSQEAKITSPLHSITPWTASFQSYTAPCMTKKHRNLYIKDSVSVRRTARELRFINAVCLNVPASR